MQYSSINRVHTIHKVTQVATKSKAMNKRAYHFFINSFLVVTYRNYKKALLLGVEHEARLIANQADALIAAILAAFTPILQAYRATDVNLLITLGSYKGKTQTVEELYQELVEVKLPLWEGKIFNFFPKGSATATALFPQGRSRFNGSTYESRIQAIEALALACNAIPDLVPVATLISAFHLQLASARALQMSDGEAKVVLLRSLREAARVALCNEMYGNMALLTHHFRTTPLEVNRFFDMSLLRTKSQSGPQDTDLDFTLVNAGTQEPITNGTAVMTLASGVTMTEQTNAQGALRFTLKAQAEPVDVSIVFSAPNYYSKTETGTIDPGDDVEGNIELMPQGPVPPAPIV